MAITWPSQSSASLPRGRTFNTHLNYAELHELRNAVGERMKEMRDTGITQLRATIAEQAELLGVD